MNNRVLVVLIVGFCKKNSYFLSHILAIFDLYHKRLTSNRIFRIG